MVSINNLAQEGILPCVIINMAFLIGGGLMLFFPPKNINGIYGYRTTRSMKNQKNWEFAQKYSARKMIQFSAICLCLCLILFLIDSSGKWATLFGLTLSISGLIMVFYTTEKAIDQL
jgi:uncharacterized membrane protein